MLKTDYRRRTTVCVALYVSLAVANCATGQVAFTTVALSGESAPGTTEQFLGGFGFPVINNAGQVAFPAAVTGDTNIRGLWSGHPGTVTLVSRRGDPAPGTPPGTVFSNFGTPTINATGQTAFEANLSGAGTTALTDSSLWAEGSLGPRLLAREGSPAPGTDPGTLFDSFGLIRPVMNDLGQVAFLGELQGATGGDGIWVEGSGGLQLVAQSGGPAPGTSSGEVFGPLVRPLINNSGTVAFRGNLTGPSVTPPNDVGIWIGNGDELNLAVREGEAAPGMESIAAFSSFESPAFNNNGQIAFGGSISGFGVDTSRNDGVWAGEPGALNLVAREGNPAPVGVAGVHYDVTLATQLNDANQVAFVSSLTGSNVVAANNFALFAGDQDNIQLVAREGSQAPGTEPGVVFFNFDFSPSRAAIANSYELNDSGRVVFQAFITGPGVDSTNNEGLWMTRPDGSLQLILRKGDLFDVNNDPLVEDFRTISSVFFTDGNRGERSGFNNNGEVTFLLFFEDGDQGVFIASLVPEPSALILIAIFSPWLVCRHRRV